MFSFGRLFQGIGGLCSTANHMLFGMTNAVAAPTGGLLAHCMASLAQMHRNGGRWIKVRKNKNPLGYNKPFAKGIVIRPVIRKPKKPNSANRKCVLIRLSTGKETIAYVPGEGHNLQEHNLVLVKVHRRKDLPGVKLECVRGRYDLGPVEKKAPV